MSAEVNNEINIKEMLKATGFICPPAAEEMKAKEVVTPRPTKLFAFTPSSGVIDAFVFYSLSETLREGDRVFYVYARDRGTTYYTYDKPGWGTLQQLSPGSFKVIPDESSPGFAEDLYARQSYRCSDHDLDFSTIIQ